MNRALLEAGLVAQQQHEAPRGAHLILLAGIVVAGVVLFGVSRWRRRRDTAAPEQQSPAPDVTPESNRSTEDE